MRLSIRSVTFRHLKVISWITVVLGLAALAAGLILPVSDTWQLAGLMLALVGVAKIAAVHLWLGIMGPGPDHQDTLSHD